VEARGLDQGLGLEISPSFSSRYIADPNDDDDWENDFSGDLFYKLTPSLTANTDFGETETDLRQVNLTRGGRAHLPGPVRRRAVA
jgi:hypothetical protein